MKRTQQGSEKKLIQIVTKTIAETLNKPIEYVHLVIHEEPKDNWGLHGDQASEVDKT